VSDLERAETTARDGAGASRTGVGRLLVLMPVYNDWEAIGALIPEIDEEAGRWAAQVDLLIVDDGSTLVQPRLEPPKHGVNRIDVLRLTSNVGHQRAIAIGLAHATATLEFDAVLVMDGDGEDRPADVRLLLERFDRLGRRCVVFAERLKRSEGPVFTLFYGLYRLFHRLLTGTPVRVGNFSVIPRALLPGLVVRGSLWSHYAAAVLNARVPIDRVPIARGTRLVGRSRMDFVALVAHGLSAIAVFSDRVGVRLLSAACVALALVASVAVGMSVAHLAWRATIPVWSVWLVGAMGLVAMQITAAALLFVLVILMRRNGTEVLPARDYVYFVQSCTTAYRR
jgi:hypothetical protein